MVPLDSYELNMVTDFIHNGLQIASELKDFKTPWSMPPDIS